VLGAAGESGGRREERSVTSPGEDKPLLAARPFQEAAAIAERWRWVAARFPQARGRCSTRRQPGMAVKKKGVRRDALRDKSIN
jgi:hypothetical protein